jgi:hypothetical protein
MNMNWKTVVAVIALGMAFSATDAAAQVRLSVAGGLSFPTGDHHLDTGYHVQVGADFGLPILPMGLRVDGAFNRFNEDHGHYQVLNGSINGVLNIPLLVATPYLIGGVGLYSAEDEAHGGERETGLGLNGGAGLRLPLPGLSVFAEARLHYPLDDHQLRFVPLSIGIRF